MKLVTLRKKIIRNISISGALLIVFGLVVFYDSHKKKSIRLEAEKFEIETSEIKSRSEELQNKISEAKKYQEAWKTISANRKFIGNLKFDEINYRINSLAEKYLISKPSIKMTTPENITNSGLLERSTVTVASSTVNLSFTAINDIKAIAFITEFVNSAPGYIIISSFEIKKTKKYDDKDLIQISSGARSGAIDAKVEFYWYFYKQKEILKNAAPIKKEVQLKETE